MTCAPRDRGPEGHPQHHWKGARKEDYSVHWVRVGLMELCPLVWLTLLVFSTYQLISGFHGVYTAVGNVVYVMWCCVTFGTAVITVVTYLSQVRV